MSKPSNFAGNPNNQYNVETIWKESSDFYGQNIRVVDTRSVADKFYTHFRATYNGSNQPTEVNYYRGLTQHSTEVGCVADVAGSLAGKYFSIYSAPDQKQYYVWFNVSGSGVDPTIPNAIGIQVDIQNNDSAQVIALAVTLTINASVPYKFIASRVQAVVEIKAFSSGETTDSTADTSGFTVLNTAGTQETTAHIVIEYDGVDPVYQGQVLKDYHFDIYSGKFEKNVDLSVSDTITVNQGTNPWVTETTNGALETTQQEVLDELTALNTSTDNIEADVDSINTKLSNNYGAASGAIRTAAQIGNTTGQADFGNGSTTAQTLRTSSNITDESGAAFTDSNYLPIGQTTHDNLNSNANIQVGNTDVGDLNRVPVSQDNTITTGSVSALAGTVVCNCNGDATVLLQVTGTFTGTLVFETSVDNQVTWHTLIGHVNGVMTAVSQTTLPNLIILRSAGAGHIRVRASAWTSGTAAITFSGSPLPGVQSSWQFGTWITRMQDSTGNNVGTDFGASTTALRSAALIGNTTGAAAFNSGATSAQTLRTASNLYNSNGSAFSDTNTLPVRVGKASQLDPLGRIRTTDLQAVFEDVFTYDDRRLWTSALTGSGTITHSTNQCVYNLATTTANGDRVQFRTRIYNKSNPGNSKILYITANFNDATTNNTKRLGMFDTNNGLFFQLAGTTLSVVTRTSSSGSPVDTAVAQASWNIDRLDGTGASGVTLNVTFMNVYVIDTANIGSGIIRFGVVINGEIIYVHQVFTSNNSLASIPVSMTLPIAFEIVNTGTVVGTPTLKAFSVSLQNESGPPFESNLRTVSSRATLKAIPASTTTPILSMRSTDIRIPLKIENFSVFLGTTDELYVSIIYGGTLTGSSFVTTGFTQMDTSATTITGGREVYSFYIKGGGGAVSEKTVDEFFRIVNTTIGSDLNGTTDILSICALSLTGAANAAAVINLRELI